MKMPAAFADRLQQSLATHAELLAVAGTSCELTYAQLNRASAQLAEALRIAGVEPGDIVPLVLRRSVALVVAEVAIVTLGAAYAPIDLTSPRVRQQAMLDQISAKVIIAEGAPDLVRGKECKVINPMPFVGDLLNVGSPSTVVTAWSPSPTQMATVMFTSGTTGVPKGVMVPASGIHRLVCDTDYADFSAGSRWGFISSPAFDLSTLEVWGPLLNGGCCVVQEIAQPSLDDLAEFLIANTITDTWLTSSLFSAMVDDRPDAFAGMRQLLVGGERVSPRHARAVLQGHPTLRLINGYGPTENTTFTLCHDISLPDCESAAGIPIGKAIRGTTVRIDSTEISASSSSDEEGELLAGGDGVALGYLHDDILTRSKFICLDGSTWYRTGDLVRRRADGVFEFLGRTDRQIKLQGNRVELEEVERILALCPGVTNCSVTVRGSAIENRHLVAVYSGSGTPPTPDVVSRYLHEHLAAAAIPARLIPLLRIPLSTTGKIDQVALSALIDAEVTIVRDSRNIFNAVDGNDDDVPKDFAELGGGAASGTEQQLIGIWRHYLPDSPINRTTNFLSAGGTSLLALQVSAQVRRKFGRNLTPIDVLRLPVLSEQARAIDAAPTFDQLSDDNGVAEFDMSLTEVQRAMLAGTALDPSGAAYLVHTALHCEGPFTGAAGHTLLQRAFSRLAARHPALRMAVVTSGEGVRTHVRPTLGKRWWNEQEQILDGVPTDLHWPADVMRVLNQPLHLARDGVMRVNVWNVDGGSTLLVWTVHHIAIDEAGIDRALVELDLLARDAGLQPVYGSPLGFATFERAWTDREAIREWPARLVGALSGHVTAVPRAPDVGDEFAVSIPSELALQVVDACTRWSVTPFTPLLAAYGLALQEVFGQTSRFVMTPISRRVDSELLEPVGCLLDITPVEAGARPGEGNSELLDRLHETVLALYRTKFFPGRAVAEAVATIDPRVADHLNAFAFTWRTNPSRTINLGHGVAHIVRVPQRGARFGLTLHTWLESGELRASVEAVNGLITNGRAAAVAGAFSKYLRLLLETTWNSANALTVRTTLHAGSADESGRRIEALRRAWSQWVNVPETSIVDTSNLLHSGGNSLTVMRMMAQIQREYGLRISTGEFLARPTFHNLRTLGVETNTSSPKYSVVVGPFDAPSVVIMFPGNGPTVEVYSLAVELQRTMGSECAVVIADLELMLERAPDDKLVEFVRDRTAKLLNEVGSGRIVAFVGYSNGGILALEFARSLAAGISPPVWLLDTYAPLSRTHRISRDAVRQVKDNLRGVASTIVRPFLRSKLIADALGTHVRTRQTRPSVPDAAAALPTAKELCHYAYNDALSSGWEERGGSEVHLVQARRSVRDETLIWRRDTNGFTPARYAMWCDHKLEATHSGLVKVHMSEVALIVSAGLQRSHIPKRTDDG